MPVSDRPGAEARHGDGAESAVPRISRISAPSGRIGIVALDHREDTLGAALEKAGLESDWTAMAQFKADAAQCFSQRATGVLLDAVAGARKTIQSGALSPSCGLVITAEDLGYIEDESGKSSRPIPSVTAEWIRAEGGHAMKLLIYARLDRPAAFARQLELSRALADQCHRSETPLLLEAQTYPLAGESQRDYATARIRQHREIALSLAEAGADILKLEYPWESDQRLAARECAQLTGRLDVPWTIFSAGVSFTEFASQLAVAMDNGCSGFVVGRALWQEAAALPADDRARWFEDVGQQRLASLAEMIS
jgi:tagatose-1,6-bisphosphate aldolase